MGKQVPPSGLTIDGAVHHQVAVNGTNLHYVAAGTGGPPILLVHGFPESWWAFRKVIPLLAANHRVYAVDLRGFGDSDPATPPDGSETLANDLHALIAHLDVGPVHLLVQDISGNIGYRLAAIHPADLLSLTAVESVLSGYGLEALADVGKGGAWYFGVLATPGAADAFFKGRAVELIGDFIVPAATARPDTVSADDVREFARGYERTGGWSGALALYRGAISDGDEIRALATSSPPALPLLAIDHGDGTATARSFGAVHSGEVEAATIADVGHYIALEGPDALAGQLAAFIARHTP